MDHINVIADTVQELLEKLGVDDSTKVLVNYDESNSVYQVLIQSKDPSILIGFHGDNIEALQTIIPLHLHHKLNEWLNISLNINNYKEKRQTSLYAMADNAIKMALSSKEPKQLPPMSSSERRIIHMYASSNDKVTSESQGEGRNRHIVISPKV